MLLKIIAPAQGNSQRKVTRGERPRRRNDERRTNWTDVIVNLLIASLVRPSLLIIRGDPRRVSPPPSFVISNFHYQALTLVDALMKRDDHFSLRVEQTDERYFLVVPRL